MLYGTEALLASLLNMCFFMFVTWYVLDKLSHEIFVVKSTITMHLNKLFQLAVFSHKCFMSVPHRKHTRVIGKILVAGKHLNLGIRGPGEKPSWGETRSSGTGGSHPGQES